MSELNRADENSRASYRAYNETEGEIKRANDRISRDASTEELESAIRDRKHAEGEKKRLYELSYDEAMELHKGYAAILAKEADVAQEKADYRREKMGITEEKEAEPEKPFAWQAAEIPELPDKKILLTELEVGGKTDEVLRAELEDVCTGGIDDYTRKMMDKALASQEKDRHPEKIRLARVQVRDLGFTKNPTTEQLLAKIGKIGELCQQTDALYLRVEDKDRPLNEWYSTAMEPVSVSDGNSCMFDLGRDDVGLELHSHWALPGDEWTLGSSIVFRPRQVSLES